MYLISLCIYSVLLFILNEDLPGPRCRRHAGQRLLRAHGIREPPPAAAPAGHAGLRLLGRLRLATPLPELHEAPYLREPFM